MQRLTAVASIIVFACALSGCGAHAPDARGARTPDPAPHVFVELRPLPDGHPPVPGFSSGPALPDGHPPIPGYDSSPALPEGHPRCPARDVLGAPPDADLDRVLQSPPELIST